MKCPFSFEGQRREIVPIEVCGLVYLGAHDRRKCGFDEWFDETAKISEDPTSTSESGRMAALSLRWPN